MEVTDPAYFGTATFGEPEPIRDCFPGDPTQKLAGTCAQGEWRPPERIAMHLPEGFRVPLDCYTAADGLRRIVPRCNFEELIDLGATCGRAILYGIRGFDQAWHDYCRALHLIHQYVCGRRYLGTRGMQEHLTRRFDYSRDLHVRSSGRSTNSRWDVLPENLGQACPENDYRPSVTRLTELGREAAFDAGYRNPTSKSAIKFSLYEMAKREPLKAKPEEIPGLMKAALFDVESFGEPPSDELMMQVTSRLSKAVAAHESDATGVFYRWFSGPNNSLIKQIAQQKNQPGGQLSREDVRRTLLHLAVEAFQFLGPCIHAAMRTIKNSIAPPLNEKEKAIFEHMHERQPEYGDLPLALLVDRTSEIERAVLAIWEEPDNHEHVQVLHRLLYYYSEMAKRRRQADTQCKQRSSQTRAELPKPDCSQAVELGTWTDDASEHESAAIDKEAPSAASDDKPFAVICDRIREIREIECHAKCSRWDYRLEGESLEEVTLRMRCECGQFDETIAMPRDEFAGHAERALDRPRLPSVNPGDGRVAGNKGD